MTFIPNEDFFLKIAKGEIAEHTKARKFGHSENLSSTEQLVSFASPITPPQLIAASTIGVTSNDVNDVNTTGTGARKLYIQGLDANWDIQSEIINLNGTTNVNSANTYIRLFRAYVTEVGTYGGANIGNLTMVAGATTMLLVQADHSQSETTFYTVPAGFTAYVYQVHMTIETNKSLEITFYQMLNANDVTTPFTGAKRIVQHYTGLVESIDFSYLESPFKFTEYTDIWFTGKTSVGSADASVEYPFILIEN